jgi:membrane-associated protein
MIEMLTYLLDLFLHLDKHLEPILLAYGGWTYVLLFLIIFCETGLVATPFLPGDSLLFAAGAFASLGQLSLTTLLVILTLAAILGDTVNYWIGYSLGPRLVRMRRFRIIQQHHLDYTHSFYEKYGGKTIVMARFVPIVRTLAPFVAGLGGMNYSHFMSYNIFGGVAWVAICTVSGYLFGNLPLVRENFSLVALAIVFLSVLPAVWEFWRASRRQTPASDPAKPSADTVPPESDA